MSVNEVKVEKATEPFQVRGNGPQSSRTFAIGDEDHTLGNSLRHVLMQSQKVEFAGYSVPHPSEPVVHIRVQTNKKSNITAVDALKEGCSTLYDQCAYVLEQLEEAMPETKEDRIRLDKIAMEEGYGGEEERGVPEEEDEDMAGDDES